MALLRPMTHMKRSSVEPWRENVGETECLEPALEQSTNHDFQRKIILLSTKSKYQQLYFLSQ